MARPIRDARARQGRARCGDNYCKRGSHTRLGQVSKSARPALQSPWTRFCGRGQPLTAERKLRLRLGLQDLAQTALTMRTEQATRCAGIAAHAGGNPSRRTDTDRRGLSWADRHAALAPTNAPPRAARDGLPFAGLSPLRLLVRRSPTSTSPASAREGSRVEACR